MRQTTKESTTAHIYRHDGTQEKNSESEEKVIHYYDTIYQTVEPMVSFPLGQNLKVRSQLLYKQDWKLPAQEYLRFKNLDLDLGLQYDF